MDREFYRPDDNLGDVWAGPDWYQWDPTERKSDGRADESIAGVGLLLGMGGLISALPAAYLAGGLLGGEAAAVAAVDAVLDGPMTIQEGMESVDLQTGETPGNTRELDIVRNFYNERAPDQHAVMREVPGLRLRIK